MQWYVSTTHLLPCWTDFEFCCIILMHHWIHCKPFCNHSKPFWAQSEALLIFRETVHVHCESFRSDSEPCWIHFEPFWIHVKPCWVHMQAFCFHSRSCIHFKTCIHSNTCWTHLHSTHVNLTHLHSTHDESISTHFQFILNKCFESISAFSIHLHFTTFRTIWYTLRTISSMLRASISKLLGCIANPVAMRCILDFKRQVKTT